MVPFALRLSVICMLPVSRLNTFQELLSTTKTPWLHTRCSPARSAFHKKWCNKKDILAVNVAHSHKHTHTIWMRPFCSVNSAGWSRVTPVTGWVSFKPILDFEGQYLSLSLAEVGGVSWDWTGSRHRQNRQTPALSFKHSGPQTYHSDARMECIRRQILRSHLFTA